MEIFSLDSRVFFELEGKRTYIKIPFLKRKNADSVVIGKLQWFDQNAFYIGGFYVIFKLDWWISSALRKDGQIKSEFFHFKEKTFQSEIVSRRRKIRTRKYKNNYSVSLAEKKLNLKVKHIWFADFM